MVLGFLTKRSRQPAPAQRPASTALAADDSNESLHVKPPRLNTALGPQPLPPLPASRRLGHDKPPPFVRHLRVLSALSFGEVRRLPSQLLRERLRELAARLPPELLPIVNLIGAQRLRPYIQALLFVMHQGTWAAGEGSLTGSDFAVQLHSGEARYLNVIDCSVAPGAVATELAVLQDFDCNQLALRFGDADECHLWHAALLLAKYEHTALNEAFTGVLLSLNGPNLLDILTLLDHKKRFARYEWCNLRLPQILAKWIRVFVVVVPGLLKRKGRVEVYTSEKLLKKLLVLYVNDADAVYNVYPEDTKMIDFNSIMKLEGEIFVNKAFEHLFAQPDDKKSKKPLLRAASTLSNGPRSRSSSVNSSMLFFSSAPSPTQDGRHSLPNSPPKSTSSHFFKKQAANHFVETNYLYLMPIPHPGVSATETMIRNFVHIVDAFHLYGRPSHLNSDKTDPILMLFGLPSLPHCGYLALDDAYDVVRSNKTISLAEEWSELHWRWALKRHLAEKQKRRNYKGDGNIRDLFDQVDSIYEASIQEVYSPRYSFAQGGSRVGSPKPIPRHDAVDFNEVLRSKELSPYQGLGKPFDIKKLYRSFLEETHPVTLTNDDMLTTLEPIMDLPTPMDDGKGGYFGDEKAYFDDKSYKVLP